MRERLLPGGLRVCHSSLVLFTAMGQHLHVRACVPVCGGVPGVHGAHTDGLANAHGFADREPDAHVDADVDEECDADLHPRPASHRDRLPVAGR